MLSHFGLVSERRLAPSRGNWTRVIEAKLEVVFDNLPTAAGLSEEKCMEVVSLTVIGVATFEL